MEGFMPTRIRHSDKSIVSMEQLAISPLRPKPTLYLQVSYTAIATVFRVLCG